MVDLPPEDAAGTHLKLLDTRGEDAGPLLQQIAKGIASRDALESKPEKKQGLQRHLTARKGHDTFSRLSRLDMPVLIAAGRYDGIAPPTNQEALHGAIENSRLEWFEGGHVFMLQDPRAGDVIREFLL